MVKGRSTHLSLNCNTVLKLNRPFCQTPIPHTDVEHLPKGDAGSTKEDEFQFKVVDVDLHKAINANYHNTHMYKLNTFADTIVLRRGTSFQIDITLSGKNIDPDSMSIEMALDGVVPSLGNRTEAVFKLKYSNLLHFEKVDKVDWLAFWSYTKIRRIIKVQISSPITCIVGKWKMKIFIDKTRNIFQYAVPGVIYMTFNPWAYDSDTNSRSEEFRTEYVLNEDGQFWLGLAKVQVPIRWHFGQFELNVFDLAINLLIKYLDCPPWNCGNYISVAMALAKLYGSGILTKPSNAKYKRGERLYKWSGSTQILKKWASTKRPIKHGELYIDAALIVTFARALGIPARIVTGYNTSRSTQTSAIFYFDPAHPTKSSDISSQNLETCNVWPEVYLKRIDIGEQFNGFQFIGGRGPVSIEAIRTNQIEKPYCSLFFHNMINSVILYWLHIPSSHLSLIRKDESRAGCLIVTKALGSLKYRDITSCYKEEKNSIPCPIADFLKTYKSGCGMKLGTLLFTECLPYIKDFCVGEDIDLSIYNNQSQEMEMFCLMIVESVQKHGSKFEQLKVDCRKIKMESFGMKSLPFKVAFKEYAPRRGFNNLFRFVYFVSDQSFQANNYSREYFQARKPRLTVETVGNVEFIDDRKNRHSIRVHIKNHLLLGQKLIKVSLRIIDSKKSVAVRLLRLKAEQDLTVIFSVEIMKTGVHTILAHFKSNLWCVSKALDFKV